MGMFPYRSLPLSLRMQAEDRMLQSASAVVYSFNMTAPDRSAIWPQVAISALSGGLRRKNPQT